MPCVIEFPHDFARVDARKPCAGCGFQPLPLTLP
jgi:hypothetical protein